LKELQTKFGYVPEQQLVRDLLWQLILLHVMHADWYDFICDAERRWYDMMQPLKQVAPLS
jgi:hypothetical protein